MKAPFLALLCCLLAAAQGGAQGAPVRIELRDEKPYAFNYGRILSQAGFGPRVELYGTTIAGVRRLLFVSESAVGLSMDFALYNDGTLLDLELAGYDAQGRPLAASHRLRFQTGSDAERRLITQLQFSYGSFPGLNAIGPEGLERGDAEYLSRQINATYFAARASLLYALALVAWTMAALLIATALARKKPVGGASATGGDSAAPARMAALILALGAALSLTALAAFGPRPYLFVIEGAQAGGRVTAAGERYLKDYAELRWIATDGMEGGEAADYLGLRSPRGAALPLSAFDGYRYLLFSSQPLVVSDTAGMLRIGGGPFLAAWGLRR